MNMIVKKVRNLYEFDGGVHAFGGEKKYAQ